MKQLFLLYSIAVLLCLCSVSCKEDPNYGYSSLDNCVGNSILTKINSIDDYKAFLLQEEDIMAYSRLCHNGTENDLFGHFVDWTPVYHNDQVVYFFLSFENGWIILSSDKRGPIELAYECGIRRNLEELNEGERTWLEKLSADIEYRWYFPYEYYNSLTSEQLNAETYCLNKWDTLKSSFNELQNADKTKGGGNLPEPSPIEPPGHYEMTYSYNTELIIEDVDHLLHTKWGQRNGFNLYCPYEDENYTYRCPAGCVNIAGAQVMYYLHNAFGFPYSSPSTGESTGYSHYNQLGIQEGNSSSSFGSYSPTMWSLMDTTSVGVNASALLIGSIGLLSRTHYDADGSSTTIDHLTSSAFSFYGIDCTYSTTYNTAIVIDNLDNDMPVIFGGNRYASLFSWPGHAWVIDGYQSYVQVTHYVYDWVYDDPNVDLENSQLYIHESYETSSLTSPIMKRLRMNWGYYGQGDNVFYSSDGTWINPIFGGNPYQFNIELAYGYSALSY